METSAENIAGELILQGISISTTTVTRILKATDYRKTRPTRKPRLTTEIRKERLQWCLDHQDRTLKDWKAVIWSDKTSVMLLHRRSGYQI
jgi:hypothetical protein